MPQATGLRRGASGAAVKALCVFVHGRGQSPEEMEQHVLMRLHTPGIAFALPRAPRGAWYDARAIDPLSPQTRAQMDEAFGMLRHEIAALRADYPGRPLLLGGFSQGACLSLEYVCMGDDPPDALVALTGCRVGTAQCDRPARAPANLPAYLTGSDADPWIPLSATTEAMFEMGRQKLALRADLFPGRGHEALDAETMMLDAMLANLAAGAPPRFGSPR
ncbi:phospholipase/carboxylesterase [Devosia enhydra]|uniref:Phospholipase/carboxylesterase n=1 Tax=Devosia enhydra TaxID=665118 RepID=A0A1K2I3S0_9HYPH|nr:phospholipase [Devosia enhydra]SFZ86867.1 phospholipase/carboxylesterase [Devosia enhydra]